MFCQPTSSRVDSGPRRLGSGERRYDMPNSKTGDDGASIDPRYDPAFQRGFEGEVATGPRGQSTLRRTAAVNPAPARMPAQPAKTAERIEPSPLGPAEHLPTLAVAPERPDTE